MRYLRRPLVCGESDHHKHEVIEGPELTKLTGRHVGEDEEDEEESFGGRRKKQHASRGRGRGEEDMSYIIIHQNSRIIKKRGPFVELKNDGYKIQIYTNKKIDEVLFDFTAKLDIGDII